MQVDADEPQVSSNDKIRVASIFNSISAIAAKISPAQSSRIGYATNHISSMYIDPRELSFLAPTGIEQILTTEFSLYSKQTMTGLKLLLVTQPTFPARAAHDMLGKIYASYTDYVLKDPFYVIDMPIRCSLFDKTVRQFFTALPPSRD